MMARHYDFIVIGGGSAGFNAARLATGFAERVAVVDGAKELGGLCILHGCMPSKTLIYAAEVQHFARHGGRFGLRTRAEAPDMPSVLTRKRAIIRDFASFREGQLQEGKFELIRSQARFVGPRELELTDGTRLTADRILISTGSTVSWPEAVPGLRQSRPWTSDQVLELDFVPESVAVLGGGVVACELAQYLARMGSKVTQIQRSPHVLRDHSVEGARVVEQALRDEGIDLHTDTQALALAFDGAEYEATFEHKGDRRTVRARHCLNALGRRPATDRLDLAAAGVETDAAGAIETDHFQQTSAPGVYAAGDCTGAHEIVHIAIQQAECATRHAFDQPVAPMDYSRLLQVVFTDPQLATVGRVKPDLDRAGTPYLDASYPFDDHGKSILMEAKYGHVRVLAAPDDGRLLGAEIVGKDAGELIHCFAVALTAGMTAADMLQSPWYHPTLSEVISYPLEDIVGKVRGNGR